MNTLVPATDGTSVSLTSIEFRRLVELEKIIEKGIRTFIEVGTALLEIKDRRLYREKFKTFEIYCHDRWGFGAHRAYQLIDASVVVQELSTTVDILPANESQARPLVGLEPDEQKEVWSIAVESTDGKPTGKAVQDAVATVKARKSIRVATDLNQDQTCCNKYPESAPSVDDEWEEEDDDEPSKDDVKFLKMLERMLPCEQPIVLFGRIRDDVVDRDRFFFKMVDLSDLAKEWSKDTIEGTITDLHVTINTLIDFKNILTETLNLRKEPRP